MFPTSSAKKRCQQQVAKSRPRGDKRVQFFCAQPHAAVRCMQSLKNDFTASPGFIKFPSLRATFFSPPDQDESALLDVYIEANATASKSTAQKVYSTRVRSQPITGAVPAKPISSQYKRRLFYSWLASSVKSGCLCKRRPFSSSAAGCSNAMTLIATCVANLAQFHCK